MMNRTDVVELVTDRLLPAFRQERERLASIDAWYRWQHEDIIVPRGATEELKSLLQLAKTPWLNLVVTNVAQSLRIDGYRTPEDTSDAAPWRLWEQNRLNGRQSAIYRAALAYGVSYGTALPGVDDFGNPAAVLRGVSPRKMLAFYDDPAEDDWPNVALRAEPAGADGWTIRLYDEEAVYFLGTERDRNGAPKLVYIEDRIHDVGVCPVVRFANMLDLDGRTDGEVEPFIPLAKRIDKTTYDRLLTQHFASWKVRTVAGMAEPDSEEAANRAKLRLRQDDMLVAEDPDTKFGTLPETPLDGFIQAYETDIKTLAAASQTPVYALVGDMINVGVEGLAAARAALDAKVAERQQTFGESAGQWLRLGALIDGDIEAAQDSMARVTWADTSIRSMAEAADALGKMATMLGIPPQGLWSMIPGATKSDIDEWKALAEQGGSLEALMRELAGGQVPPEVPGGGNG